MAIPFTMKRKNGSGYDVLYPATKQELVAGCQKKIWIASKTLTSAGWVATEDGYSTQNVTIAGGTATTQVDVQGNYAAFRQMLDDGTTNIYIVNNGGTFTAYAVGETPTADLAVQVTCSDVTPPPTPVYGIDFTNMATTSKCTRTDDAANFADPNPAVAGGTGSSPFDNIMPWSGMVRSTDPNAGEVVAIPKFYFKWETDGTKATGLKISMEKKPGFNTSPAHMDRGDGKGERDVIYVGRYHSCSTNKSTTGQMPKVSITRSDARTAAHSLGSNVWQFDFATRVTIWMLYLVEFADWNSQAKIGYGCGDDSNAENVGDDSNAENVGASDGMQYHTGTMQADRTTYGVGVQYRNIEGLWDNVYGWMDGCYYSSNGMSVVLNPNNFSDTENGTAIGTPSNGHPSAFVVSDWAIYPNAKGGSSTTGSCDPWYYNSSFPCLFCGGDYYRIENHGLFFVRCDGVSGAASNVGFRVIVLP